MIIVYTYIGYAFILWFLTRFIRRKEKNAVDEKDLPKISHLIAAYNEEALIAEKVENALSSDYPKGNIQHVFVTDGSTDGTVNILNKYAEVDVYHQPERAGKLAAINRVLPFIDSDIIILSDANAMTNPSAFRQMVNHFKDDKVGVVAGEKVIQRAEKDDASSAGEGIYWKYESCIKHWESIIYSTIGAAGELYAIRKQLYESPDPNLLIEDFVTSMKIAMKGYKIAYEPNATAIEKASASISEEQKRKVRIAAGGFQTVLHLKNLLSPFHYGVLSLKYISHRVLRWTLAPLSLVVLLVSNFFLASEYDGTYTYLLWAQLIFYVIASIGFLFRNNQVTSQFFFLPFYFTFMNYCCYLGFFKLVKGDYTVNWERAERKI